MKLMLSSSFSNALLGGLATFAFLSFGSSLVWAAVIAWGCFFHTGGDSRALAITIIGNILGIVTGWTIGVGLTHNPGLPDPIWAGLVVFVLVIIMVFIGQPQFHYFSHDLPGTPDARAVVIFAVANPRKAPIIIARGIPINRFSRLLEKSAACVKRPGV